MGRINNRYKRDMIEINKRGGARKGSGRKKGITELGSEFLKSFKATQHLFAVDQGET